MTVICVCLLCLGCLKPSYPNLASNLAYCQEALNETQINNTILQGNLSSQASLLANKTFENDQLSGALSVSKAETLNCTQRLANATPIINYSLGKDIYGFTCQDVYSGFDFQTKYRCFWEVRTHYGTGKYTSMADLCISNGLPDACLCYWTMKEFVGTRISTGVGLNDYTG